MGKLNDVPQATALWECKSKYTPRFLAAGAQAALRAKESRARERGPFHPLKERPVPGQHHPLRVRRTKDTERLFI